MENLKSMENLENINNIKNIKSTKNTKNIKNISTRKKIFNINADCQPDLHYMVNLSERLKKVKIMVDAGEYFTINRARQYGKTTLLKSLKEFLKEEYLVISLDFQMISASKFKDEHTFCTTFARLLIKSIETTKLTEMIKPADTIPSTETIIPSEEPAKPASPPAAQLLAPLKNALQQNSSSFELFELFDCLSELCQHSSKPVVLMIDEVDSASNNQVFLDFLAQLRACYIARRTFPTFQSVILASVYDVRNIRRKLRPDEEHKQNSPWNIAADFLVDMSFSPEDIAGMLTDYEKDHLTGMDIPLLSSLLYDYTSGYPFLVSRICKILDERIAQDLPSASAWTKAGFLEAIRLLLTEKNPLFDSLSSKLDNYPELKQLLNHLLFQGQDIMYNPDDPAVDIALMFGFIKIEHACVVVANRIFEMRLYNMFLTFPKMQENATYKSALQNKNQFIQDGHLRMDLLLQKFVTHFDDVYGDQKQQFVEEDGRRYFLLYLKPILNGSGNYYIEARTRNLERTDVIIDYQGEQFVVEIKIWRGNAYHTRGEKQLTEYLNHYHLDKGYMLSFNFNQKKTIGVKEIRLGDKILIEAVC